MIDVTQKITITLEPKDLAKEFCNMNADYQAEFFNAVYKITQKWQSHFVLQLQSITDSPVLNDGGRIIMCNIGDYSSPSTISEDLKP